MELDAFERQLEDELGELTADAVQPLSRQFEFHRPGRGIVAGDAGARLDRRHDEPVVHHLDLDNVRRLLHRLRHRRDVALADVEGEIARRLVPDRRRTGDERRRAFDHGWQRLVIDLDQLGCRARDLLTVGDDEGHRIADMAHTTLGQCRPRRHDQRLHRRHAGQWTQPVGRKIGRRIDAVNAGKRRAPRNVDPLYERMGVRRAHDMAMQIGCTGDVGNVAPLSGQEAGVLEPAYRPADHA